MTSMPSSLLIANRGEISRRIIRTANRLGVKTIAVYHPVDAKLPFVAEAAVAIPLEGETPVKAYLDADQIIDIATEQQAAAIHPGYGFLAENSDFARAVTAAGITWVGPSPESIDKMGDKVESRATVAAVGVPISGDVGKVIESPAEAIAEAEKIGYPVMVKASAGGGGIGMAIADDAEQLTQAFANTRSMASRSFGSDRVFIERYIASARHIEVQVLGLADGTVVAFGERDCSTQRRHQKVVEESPAPNLSEELREQMRQAAIKAAQSVGYLNAGTVEFLVDVTKDDFVFLEMNTRIQVEHPITEMTHGVDLIEQQLAIAHTGTTTADFNPQQQGHAFELRICAEDPRMLLPRPGPIGAWVEPEGEGIRVDSGYAANTEVTQHFDSLVAKLCAWGPNRETALSRVATALAVFEIEGLTTNAEFIAEVLSSDAMTSGFYDTGIVGVIQEQLKAERKRQKALAKERKLAEKGS